MFTLLRFLYTLFLNVLARFVLGPLGLASPVYLDASPKSPLLNTVRRSCPSLYGPLAWYIPPLYLANGHLQTIYCVLANFMQVDQIDYRRVYLRVPDGGTISLDFPITKTSHHKTSHDDTPILVVLHGLTGGSHESYVRSVLSKVIARPRKGGLGWRAVVVNSRGCSDTPVTSKQLYNAGWTRDIKIALLYISQHYPNAPVFGLGFSLGASILANYIGKSGLDTPMRGAVVLGCPWDLYRGHLGLCRSFLGSIYSKAMAKNLRTLFRRHIHMFVDDERLNIDWLLGNENATLYECDSLLVGPLGGFARTEDYYTSQSATRSIDGISIPTLSINSIDDPIVAFDSIPRVKPKQQNLIMASTLHGGHLGWFNGLRTIFTKKRWVVDPVVEFISAVHREQSSPVSTLKLKIKGHRPVMKRDKFIVDEEDPLVGYMELPKAFHQRARNQFLEFSTPQAEQLTAGF